MLPGESKARNVLLTGGRAPVTLELARLFAAAGHRVYVAESVPLHICHFSSAVQSNLAIPAPNTDIDGFADALSELINEYAIDYLVPTCEEVFHVSRVMARLPDRCTVFTDTIDKLKKLHSKKEFMEYATSFGLPLPQTRRVTSLAEVYAALSMEQDFVLKKVYSRFSSDVIIRPQTHDDVAGIQISEDSPWVIQEYLGTKQFCTYTVAKNGKIAAHAIYPTSHTAGQGASTYFEAIDCQAIYNWIETFLAAIEYTGQVSFDFIEAPSGQILPIECNPRATSGAHLFQPSDRVDEAFFGVTEQVICPQSRIPTMLGLGMALYGIPAAIRSRGLRRWFGDWLKARDVIFSRHDPLPALGQMLCFLVFGWIALKNGCTALAASTLDIEWDGNLPPDEGPPN